MHIKPGQRPKKKKRRFGNQKNAQMPITMHTMQLTSGSKKMNPNN